MILGSLSPQLAIRLFHQPPDVPAAKLPLSRQYPGRFDGRSGAGLRRCGEGPHADSVRLHARWGAEAQGNYDEFRFFTGLRPSEQIALTVDDFDAERGTLSVTKARVCGVLKNSTKTREDRLFELCPRARAVLARQLRLRERLVSEGRIAHERLFFFDDGAPIEDLRQVHRRWRQTMANKSMRYRKPYSARHSSVSWNLMIGKCPLWVARQHGHKVPTMLGVYAGWPDGAVHSDIEVIERAMGKTPQSGGVLSRIRRLFTRSAPTDIRVRTPRFSVWHWICHHERGLCS